MNITNSKCLRHYFNLATVVAIAGGCLVHEAFALEVPPSDISISVWVSPTTIQRQSRAQYGVADQSEFTSESGTTHIFQAAGGYVGNLPFLRLSNLSGGNPCIVDKGSFGCIDAWTKVSGNLNYYVGVRPDNDIYLGMAVPLLVHYNMSLTQEVSPGTVYPIQTSALALIEFMGGPVFIDMQNYKGSAAKSQTISKTGILSRTVGAGGAYRVHMESRLDSTFAGLINSYVDPYFEIDPTFALASHFSLFFSDGAGNSLPVPEPSPLHLMLIGCLAVVLLVRPKTQVRG